MTRTQYTRKRYLATIEKLGLRPGVDKRTAHMLGVTPRHAARLSAGTSPVTGTLARLLWMFQKFGLPDDEET
jgi:hypothetical protein